MKIIPYFLDFFAIQKYFYDFYKNGNGNCYIDSQKAKISDGRV